MVLAGLSLGQWNIKNWKGIKVTSNVIAPSLSSLIILYNGLQVYVDSFTVCVCECVVYTTAMKWWPQSNNTHRLFACLMVSRFFHSLGQLGLFVYYSFSPRVIFLCLSREPNPQKTQKAPHHRPHQLKTPTPKTRSTKPQPQISNHH